MANINSRSPQRVFIIGGLLLILTGMIFGDIFAVFILHPNIANIGKELYAATQAILGQDSAAVSLHFSRIGSYMENAGTKIDTHVHVIKFGFLALILALLQPYVSLSERHKLRLSQCFLFGAILLPCSVFLIHYIGMTYSPFKSIGWASISADLSGFVVILVCIAELYGLIKYIKTADTLVVNPLQKTLRESRALLGGGALLLLTGFLFGAYYAAFHFDANESKEISTLNQIVEKSVNNNPDAIKQSLDDYGLLQGKRGLSIAAHAHINEFGMLALLLAFIQPFIFLSPQWRWRWVKLMLFGSVLLPLSVLSELKFGLPAMILADTGGLLIIIALFGMFTGILRFTGKQDANAEIVT